MNTLNVKAAPGLQLPKEGAPRTYITDAAPVQVEASHYYRKAIADGDLVEVPAEEPATPARAAKAVASAA
jgi:hypothetical protein